MKMIGILHQYLCLLFLYSGHIYSIYYTNMLQTKYTTSQTTEYVAMNIGVNKDNYAIESYFKHDLNTDNITVRYTLVKNWIHNERTKGKVYKNETKFREIIATDTYQRLATILTDIIAKESLEPITN